MLIGIGIGIGIGDRVHRDRGHGFRPYNLHNGSYAFNDDLISLGATYWLRLTKAFFNRTT